VPPFRFLAPVQRSGETIGGVGPLVTLRKGGQSACGAGADHREPLVHLPDLRMGIRQRLFSW
jgi:hypothetical protein